MYRLLWATLLPAVALAQRSEDATELLRRVRSVAERTTKWRAEIVEKTEMLGANIDLKTEVRTRIAVEAPLKISRQNSGDDQTILVCDGAESFYSGDRHSFYREQAQVNSGCILPLSKFYELEYNPATASIVGHDHVRLADGDRECVLVRAAWKHNDVDTVHTVCIDPASTLILRDIAETKNENTGMRMVKTTAFTTFESNPRFQPDTFKFSIPPGAVETKPPL